MTTILIWGGQPIEPPVKHNAIWGSCDTFYSETHLEVRS